MSQFKNGIVILLILVFSCSAWADTGAVAAASGGIPVPGPGVAQRKLRSGDTLNIVVWQNKDLSTSVTVDENGNIEYLFLGIIPAAGRTLSEVKEVIRKGIAENYVVNPRIDITVDHKTLTIFVAGEVTKPGTYEFKPGTTVLEAIALAGGFTDYASQKVKIIRKVGENQEKEVKINTKKLLKATRNREESKIQVDDIVVAERALW